MTALLVHNAHVKVAVVPTLLLIAFLGGCRTTPPLPPVDLQASGWSVRQGQAVWTAARGEDGVAGELLLASQTDGACFVQFAKPPFTLATARSEAGGWSVELLSARRHFGGHGQAPAQFVWFALANALRKQPADGAWHFAARGPEGWCLTNAVTSETLEGYFAP